MKARPWLLAAMAGCTWAHLSLAQTGTTSPGGLGTPGGVGAPSTPLPGNVPSSPGATPGSSTEKEKEKEKEETPTPPPKKPPAEKPPGDTPPRNPFGFDDPVPADPNTRPLLPLPGNRQLGPGEASSTFSPGTTPTPATDESEGTSTAKPRTDENATTFTAPGFLGSVRQTFTAGQGRFAKPKFRYGASAGIGFDDNYQQTPDNTGSEADIFVQVIPAVEEISTTRNVSQFIGLRNFGGTFKPVFRTVQEKVILRPFQPEQRIETPIPAIPPTPRLSSIVSTFDVNFSTQWAKARTALTLDLRLGAEYYWDREKDPIDYTGSLGLTYIRKLSPRMQFTTNASVSHQTQPDFQSINVGNETGGAYTNGFLKFDLAYRWSPRFSTDTSLTTQGVLYDSTGINSGNSFYEMTLGNEFRYIRSRKTTYVLDLRYGATTYLEDDTRNSTSTFVLVGMDQRWSSRLSSTFRLGQALRQFQEGDAQASPYGEVSAVYRADVRSQFQLTSRYGFEQTQAAGQKNITFRTSLNYNRSFSPRLSGALGINYVQSEVTSEGSDTPLENTTTDGYLSFNYRVNRRLNLNARYSYTMLKSTLGFSDYNRSRFFLTGSYDF